MGGGDGVAKKTHHKGENDVTGKIPVTSVSNAIPVP